MVPLKSNDLSLHSLLKWQVLGNMTVSYIFILRQIDFHLLSQFGYLEMRLFDTESESSQRWWVSGS